MTHLQLVRDSGQSVLRRAPVSHDTIDCLRALLGQAERGEIIGISYSCLRPGEKMVYGYGGEAWSNTGKAAALSSVLLHGTMQRIFEENE